MARTIAELPPGSRVTDYISLGVIAEYFPPDKVNAILSDVGKSNIRQRDLPAHVVVYYVVALALYMQSSYREVLRCLLEGIQWLRDPESPVRVAGKSGISQARSRLGWEPLYRLVTTILDPVDAPAEELAALYHQRWEIETAFDELKTHLRGAKIVLRSKTPDLVRQEFYGLLLAHFAIRGLMHEAATEAGAGPGDLSFMHAVRVIRRRLPRFAAIPPSGSRDVPRRDPEGNPGGSREPES
jgi:IS4 transposase